MRRLNPTVRTLAVAAAILLAAPWVVKWFLYYLWWVFHQGGSR